MKNKEIMFEKEFVQNDWIKKQRDSLKDKKTWENRLGKLGKSSGLYFYVSRDFILYPFGENKIFYIGRGKPISKRLVWHFNKDSDKKLIPNGKTSEWFFQNYYLDEKPFDIFFIKCEYERSIKLERLFIGLFADMYGALPQCNSSVQRIELKNTYNEYQKSFPNIINQIRQCIKEYEKSLDS